VPAAGGVAHAVKANAAQAENIINDVDLAWLQRSKLAELLLRLVKILPVAKKPKRLRQGATGPLGLDARSGGLNRHPTAIPQGPAGTRRRGILRGAASSKLGPSPW